MKKIFVLLLTIALVVVMVGAAFTAAFSDVEQSTGNTLTAGTLNLTINGVDGENADAKNITIDLGPLKPGDSGEAKCWKIQNEGSIPGVLTFEVADIVNYENVRLEMEEDAGDFTTGEKEGELGSQLLGTWRYLVPGTVDQWESWDPRYIDFMLGQEYAPEIGALNQGDAVTICLDYSFVDTEANNVAQSDGVKFNVVFELKQSETE